MAKPKPTHRLTVVIGQETAGYQSNGDGTFNYDKPNYRPRFFDLGMLFPGIDGKHSAVSPHQALKGAILTAAYKLGSISAEELVRAQKESMNLVFLPIGGSGEARPAQQQQPAQQQPAQQQQPVQQQPVQQQPGPVDPFSDDIMF